MHSISAPLAILFALALAGRYLPGARAATLHWADIVGSILLHLFSVAIPVVVLLALHQGELSVETHLSVPFSPVLACVCAVAVSLTGAWLIYQSCAWLLRRQGLAGIPWIIASWTLLLCMLLLLMLPLADRSQYSATAQAGRYIREMPEQRVVAYLDHFPEGLVYYSHHHVTEIHTGDADAAATMAQTFAPGVLVVTNAEGMTDLRGRCRLEELQEISPVIVARITDPMR